MALTDWSGFFSAEVGASAALVGLVTVAISINLPRILEIAHLPSRAGESLFALTVALTICSVALFPGISVRALGGVALALASSSLLFGARNQFSSLSVMGVVGAEKQIVGAIARLGSYLPIAIGAVLLLLQADAGLAWIAAGVVITLAVSVMNAWVLLVEIMR